MAGIEIQYKTHVARAISSRRNNNPYLALSRSSFIDMHTQFELYSFILPWDFIVF